MSYKIPSPISDHSFFETNIVFLKSVKELKIAPPNHEENFLSGGAITFTVFPVGAKDYNSFSNFFLIFIKRLDPPHKITFWNKSFSISSSHFLIDLKVCSCNPK